MRNLSYYSSSYFKSLSSASFCLAAILTLIPVVFYLLQSNTPFTFLPSPSLLSPSSGLLGNAENNLDELHERLANVSEESPSLSTKNSSPSASLSSPSPPNAENTSLLQPEVRDSLGVRRINGYSKLDKVEASLAKARAMIKEAIMSGKQSSSAQNDPDYVPEGSIYWNARAFHRSYLEMEKVFKIFVYKEGEPPLFHDGPCKSIYSTEGRFIHDLELDNRFRTKDPDRAHAHFLPMAITTMVHYLYKPYSYTIDPIRRTIADYIDVISHKYPYWNRSLGADHFIVSCHDWGPEASGVNSYLYNNSIRVLCNANSSEGFNPSKDVTLPEINLVGGGTKGLIGGPSPSQRPILGFFAGGEHGPIRSVLLKHWKNKDEDLQVYEYLSKGVNYYDKMRKSRFCLCPSGYEVASPRIVEALWAECVPVIISDHYVLPFSDVLNYKSFSIQLSVSDIPKLKSILMGISQSQYVRMQRRVKKVQRHFVVNHPPKRYDVFHMILHSVWLRRLNIRVGLQHDL